MKMTLKTKIFEGDKRPISTSTLSTNSILQGFQWNTLRTTGMKKLVGISHSRKVKNAEPSISHEVTVKGENTTPLMIFKRQEDYIIRYNDINYAVPYISQLIPQLDEGTRSPSPTLAPEPMCVGDQIGGGGLDQVPSPKTMNIFPMDGKDSISLISVVPSKSGNEIVEVQEIQPTESSSDKGKPPTPKLENKAKLQRSRKKLASMSKAIKSKLHTKAMKSLDSKSSSTATSIDESMEETSKSQSQPSIANEKTEAPILVTTVKAITNDIGPLTPKLENQTKSQKSHKKLANMSRAINSKLATKSIQSPGSKSSSTDTSIDESMDETSQSQSQPFTANEKTEAPIIETKVKPRKNDNKPPIPVLEDEAKKSMQNPDSKSSSTATSIDENMEETSQNQSEPSIANKKTEEPMIVTKVEASTSIKENIELQKSQVQASTICKNDKKKSYLPSMKVKTRKVEPTSTTQNQPTFGQKSENLPFNDKPSMRSLVTKKQNKSNLKETKVKTRNKILFQRIKHVLSNAFVASSKCKLKKGIRQLRSTARPNSKSGQRRVTFSREVTNKKKKKLYDLQMNQEEFEYKNLAAHLDNWDIDHYDMMIMNREKGDSEPHCYSCVGDVICGMEYE